MNFDAEKTSPYNASIILITGVFIQSKYEASVASYKKKLGMYVKTCLLIYVARTENIICKSFVTIKHTACIKP